MSFYSLPLLIASDHAGWDLKQHFINQLKQFNWKDLGCFNSNRTDYTDWASKLCLAMQKDLFGVLICGTGQGMCIKANRYPKIRAALVFNQSIAKLARAHNDANVICLPSRFLQTQEAFKILDVFLKTSFDKQTAYQRRVKKL